ncbi:MAG TPA: type II secretion system protein G [Candidatus Wallbacteria bacterium]|nr:type II secretion system protein G [Candidatus Wallbacteria bacterium]
MIITPVRPLKNKIYINYRGISLLEFVTTIFIALILIGTTVYYQEGAVENAKASALKQTLTEIRKAIDTYYEVSLTKSPPGKYPTLDELVPNYLRSFPVDPVTHSNVWIITKDDYVNTCLSTDVYTGAYDVKSTDPRYKNL